jgi:hypothetical protein
MIIIIAPMKYDDPRQPTPFEDSTPSLGFEKREAKKEDHTRAKRQRLVHEFFDDVEGWVGDDGLDTGGRFRLVQKVADEMQAAVVDDIARDDRVPTVAQEAHNGTAARRRLPDAMRELFNLDERRYRDRRGLVQIKTPFGIRVALNLA